MKKTKIICTIGPSCWDEKIIKEMYEAGMNIARINASFADHDELARVSKLIRRISPNIGLMLDTKGHKIRINKFERSIMLEKGEEFVISTKPQKGRIYVTYKSLNKDVTKDSVVLVDEGKIQLRVKEIKETEIKCIVEIGGELKTGKSINLPGTHLSFPPLTDKDFEDIQYAVKNGFDFIAASFIRNVEDLRAIKKITKGSRTKIIAKIENPESVANFDSILAESEGIMIARGDLGIEVPAEQVPFLQKRFIKQCRREGKPVIVATQMLESMILHTRPTRAEVSDVANAIYDGTDATMLSAETSSGKHPVETVKYMSKIALEIEEHIEPRILDTNPIIAKPVTNAIAKAVIDICNTIPIDKILVATATGTTAIAIARHLPKQNIYAFTRDEGYLRKMSLVRGVTGAVMNGASANRELGVMNVIKSAKEHGFIAESDLVVIVAGSNILGEGSTNMLEVQRIGHLMKHL